MSDDIITEGFEELEEAGFIVTSMALSEKDGVRTLRPAFPIEHLINCGFLGKGKRVRFLNKNGYDSHLEYARRAGLTEGMILTVKSCSVENWSSDYTFDEVDGSFNTVMFKEVVDE